MLFKLGLPVFIRLKFVRLKKTIAINLPQAFHQSIFMPTPPGPFEIVVDHPVF
jgi:hypothetical protein